MSNKIPVEIHFTQGGLIPVTVLTIEGRDCFLVGDAALEPNVCAQWVYGQPRE